MLTKSLPGEPKLRRCRDMGRGKKVRIDSIVRHVVSGDAAFEGIGRVGRWTTFAGIAGLFTTQNFAYVGATLFGLATLFCQIWWEFYRLRRRAWIDVEVHKAMQLKKLQDLGITTAIPALKQSNDPDA